MDNIKREVYQFSERDLFIRMTNRLVSNIPIYIDNLYTIIWFQVFIPIFKNHFFANSHKFSNNKW